MSKSINLEQAIERSTTDLDVRQNFYAAVLKRCIVDRSASILNVASGPRDKQVFQALGYSSVTFSNLDDTYGTAQEFRPFDFSHQNAEALSFADSSFDFVVIHAALHHCRSPHRALLEMHRVARFGVLAFEARDSVLMRLLERCGMTETYEKTGVFYAGGGFGGVCNGPVPNFIYRWTEREVEKAVNTFAPHLHNSFLYFYGHDAPAALLYPGRRMKKTALRIAYAAYRGLAWFFPRQQNLFSFFVTKPELPGGLQPWIELVEGSPRLDMSWARKQYSP